MVGWHHRLNGHEFEQTPGDSEGQGGLACCSPWGHKESDTTEPLSNDNKDADTRCRVGVGARKPKGRGHCLCLKFSQIPGSEKRGENEEELQLAWGWRQLGRRVEEGAELMSLGNPSGSRWKREGGTGREEVWERIW